MRFVPAIPTAAAAAALSILTLAPTAQAQPALTTTRVALGLSGPLWVTHAPGDFTRVFVVEKRSGSTGRIRILQLPSYTLLPTPFLSVTGLATADAEQGLLGLAFHPNYATNGHFYVYYTLPGGSFGNGLAVIARYTRDFADGTGNTANAASQQIVLTFDKPQTNHNGGWLQFGPDGFLYIGTGDGGGGGDTGTGHTTTFGNSQDRSKRLGKILRVDVNADDFPADPNNNYGIPATNPFIGVAGVLPEIWAYGVRNPWRNDFDPVTGDLYIADVGQDLWEEINFQPANAVPPGNPGYQGGKNYGWRCYEGTATYNTSNCPASGTLTFPFLVYGHSTSVPPTNATGCSITGGAVYRGCAIPNLDGTYFFSDYCSGKIFSLKYNGVTLSNFTDRTVELDPAGTLAIQNVQGFGRDAYGEIYICDANGGEVYKIIPAAVQGPDCNGNGQRDACDIRAGISRDINLDGVPDSCRCPADWDGNGAFQPLDIASFINAWSQAVASGTLGGDYDGNGAVNPADVAAMVNAWFTGLSNGTC